MKKGGRNKSFSLRDNKDIFSDSHTQEAEENKSFKRDKRNKFFSLKGVRQQPNPDEPEPKTLKRHSSQKRYQRRRLPMTRKNSSPVNLRQDISELDVNPSLFMSMTKTKLNSSFKEFKRPLSQSRDRDDENEKFPEVVKNNDNFKPENAPQRLGTFFGAAKNPIMRKPMAWESKAPSLKNIPLKANQSMLDKDNQPKEITKTTEHLEMLKKLEEYKSFVAKSNINKPGIPKDLESTHQLDSFVDSINTIL